MIKSKKNDRYEEQEALGKFIAEELNKRFSVNLKPCPPNTEIFEHSPYEPKSDFFDSIKSNMTADELEIFTQILDVFLQKKEEVKAKSEDDLFTRLSFCTIDENLHIFKNIYYKLHAHSIKTKNVYCGLIFSICHSEVNKTVFIDLDFSNTFIHKYIDTDEEFKKYWRVRFWGD